MATAAIADELTCPVCLEFYKDPRVLPCQHSLCKSCLVVLLSKREKDSNCDLQCPSCRYLFNAKNETHIEALPKNFTLASIVCKFQASLKGDTVFPCDLCEEGQKGRAIKKCFQCQFNYCRMCLEQLHPKRGALANHNLVHIMDAQGEEHEHEEPNTAFSSLVSENQSISTNKCDQLMQVRYCLSCDAMFTTEDQMSAVGCHDYHDTTEMHTAFRTKKEEFQRTLGRLLDQDMELEKGLATIRHQIETIRKSGEEKKVELVHRFGEVTKEIESKKISAENRIEEEMKMRVNSLESLLRELEDHKRKTQIKKAAFSELSSLTNDDAVMFFMKLKELQDEIDPVAEDYIKQAVTGTRCDSSLPIEQLVNEIIANATRDICTSETRLQAPDPILAATDISPQHANMAIQVANVQSEGTMSADIEWVAIDQVDHYEMSYFCDPEETVLRRNILENRCRLTNLRWDSNYTITVTAHQQDGKTSLDSTVFKTDPKLNDSTLADTDKSQQHASLAIKVTSVQNEGTMSADVEWVAIDQVDHYEISYFCDPGETVLRRNIVKNRCRLTNLKWDATYAITVTAYQPYGKTSLDSTVFKTHPKVKVTKPAIVDIPPKKVKMSIKVTKVQKAGTMSADVKWSARYQPSQYEVTYQCNKDERVVLNNITENRCRLTNLRWNSTYLVMVTTELQDGTIGFSETTFQTDPQVMCFPMIAAEVCNRKISVRDSFQDFEASDRTKNWVSFRKVGEFSGIVFAPVLQEDLQFWTMKLELSIFEKDMINQTFLDFGIINYSDLAECFGLTNNTKAYSCSIFGKTEMEVQLRFQSPFNVNEYSYALPLKLYQKERLCFGFLYDKIHGLLAVMDCKGQEVLYVFCEVRFRKDYPLIFAICPYHTEVKMRVDIDLDYMHSTNENISSWISKIYNF